MLHKKIVLNGPTSPVGSVCNEAKHRTKPNDIRNGQSLPRDKAIIPPDAQDPLDAPAPPHAFPSTYPPPSRYKPFSENITLQSHFWRKQSLPVRSLSATSVSDLVEMFSQLSVRDDYDHRPQMHSTRPSEIGAAIVSTVIKPFSAPLFAACQPVKFVAKAAFAPFPTVPAPRTPLHPFRTPSPQAQPFTLIPSSIQQTSKSRRKVAPLPKRTPQVSTKIKQDLTLSTPDYSNHRSPCSSVRSSSSELSPSVASSPEVGSPLLLSLPGEVSLVGESRLPTGEDVFGSLTAESPSGKLRSNSSLVSDHMRSTISEISISQGNPSAIVRTIRRAVPPPYTRLPLCIGS